ncbi:MAG: response regulator [Bacteroidetes bacterium]|nr:MAG: response regulator [Bacteroidota bacterium]
MNKRIFLVDDDPFWTAMLSRILTDLGYDNIYTFDNGTDCVNNLHLNPCMIFLDYKMEDVNGLEVLQQIKAYYSGMKVVFCTAHEDLSVAVSAIENGSFDYLLKDNVTPEEVSKIITEAEVILEVEE